MENKVRRILEEFLRKHYIDRLTSCVNIPYEDDALSSLKSVFLSALPEEKDNSIWTKATSKSRKLADMIGGAEIDGFNFAISQCKERIEEMFR